MKYYGKSIIEKVEHRLCEYIRCDNCNKKITDGEKYYSLTTGHHDWGNDSIDSIEHPDVCVECLKKFISDYFKEYEDSDTAYLDIETDVFCANSNNYGDYDWIDGDKLVEKDLEGEDNESN